MGAAQQQGLFGHAPPRIDGGFARLCRHPLDDEAWVDHLPGWVSGHEALFQHLRRAVPWQRARQEMYERVVDVPRLVAELQGNPPHPLVEDMRRRLSGRYRIDFSEVTFALYRDGQDSVAWHGDRVARELPAAVVATVSLGAPRRFLLRPAAGGAARRFSLGWGDLLVMGGSCQRTWRHAVPKARHADPRMVVMFRPRFGGADPEHIR